MVVKIVELVGVSEKNYEDAIAQAVARASKTIKNISGVDVLGMTASVKDGRISEYRADLKIAFVVKD